MKTHYSIQSRRRVPYRLSIASLNIYGGEDVMSIQTVIALAQMIINGQN